jgi:hypothetical protein
MRSNLKYSRADWRSKLRVLPKHFFLLKIEHEEEMKTR